MNHKRYTISLGNSEKGIIRKVIDTFARPTDSWDEAVGGEGYNAMAEGDFCNEGNGFGNNEKKQNLKRDIFLHFCSGLEIIKIATLNSKSRRHVLKLVLFKLPIEGNCSTYTRKVRTEST